MAMDFARFAEYMIARAGRRPPDELIGPAAAVYIRRWFVIPPNRLLNIYLHEIQRSDSDRALHDHPWANLSIPLRGRYVEHTIRAGGVHRRRLVAAGGFRLRLPRTAHRLELVDGLAWSLFITGPKVRAWGFHCPDGWVHWRVFNTPRPGGTIKGCGP